MVEGGQQSHHPKGNVFSGNSSLVCYCQSLYHCSLLHKPASGNKVNVKLLIFTHLVQELSLISVLIYATAQLSYNGANPVTSQSEVYDVMNCCHCIRNQILLFKCRKTSLWV
jgi:hypothetical protein